MRQNKKKKKNAVIFNFDCDCFIRKIDFVRMSQNVVLGIGFFDEVS